MLKLAKIDYFEIYHEDSETNKGLQSVDFIAGAIGYKYNNGISMYVDIIKNNIVIEKNNFFKK